MTPLLYSMSPLQAVTYESAMDEFKNGKADAIASFLPSLKASDYFFLNLSCVVVRGCGSSVVCVREKTTIS